MEEYNGALIQNHWQLIGIISPTHTLSQGTEEKRVERGEGCNEQGRVAGWDEVDEGVDGALKDMKFREYLCKGGNM
ncbi:hypothetical protein AVEN_219882-1, partial [Araneus ventricosus]